MVQKKETEIWTLNMSINKINTSLGRSDMKFGTLTEQNMHYPTVSRSPQSDIAFKMKLNCFHEQKSFSFLFFGPPCIIYMVTSTPNATKDKKLKNALSFWLLNILIRYLAEMKVIISIIYSQFFRFIQFILTSQMPFQRKKLLLRIKIFGFFKKNKKF